MSSNKTALLSPAVNAQQAMPSADDEKRLFEDKFGEMAYQAFTSKFPDLVVNTVTFKILDSDIEAGTAVGSFILEDAGEFIYVPAVLADNQLKPFDIMYVKSKDIFLPLDAAWMEEIQKGALQSLGEGAKLPDTVATDVDIRNIAVPPTTGRYSYASHTKVTPRNRLEAEATEPLGRKLAQMGGFPGAPPPAAPGASGQPFNPEIWATFVEHFQRINGTTPGQALDNSMMDLDTMAKMYKSHMKTWEMPNQGDAAQGAQPIDPATGMPADPSMSAPVGTGQPIQQTDPMPSGAPKMAGAKETAAREVAEALYEPAGQALDRYLGYMGRGALTGAGTGAVYAGLDQELGDVPAAALRGAIGGTMGAIPGRLAGRALAAKYPKAMPMSAAGPLGTHAGGAGGGFLMARSDPRTLAQWTRPSQAAMREYYQENPEQMRTASDQGVTAMVKHALASSKHALKLPEFLERAPNQVKTAFSKVLNDNTKLLKIAGDIYGEDTLIKALQHKEAGMISMGGGALYIADEKTKPSEYAESFGSAAPEAFNGVLLRGYHFKDTRPKLNLAVQTQEYHDFHDAKEPGVYRLYNTQGVPKPALVLYEPWDLMEFDRPWYPENKKKVKPQSSEVPVTEENREPHALCISNLDGAHETVGSKKEMRLAILGNGDYLRCDQLMGEQVTEVLLKGTRVYKRAMTDKKSPPAKGLGTFVHKRGVHYVGTFPVKIETLTTSSDGVLRGKMTSPGGIGSTTFVMDPRSPRNRPMRLRKQNLVVIPAQWKWIPLNKQVHESNYLRTSKALSEIALNALGSMGTHEAVARSAGQSMYAVDGSKTTSKKAALLQLATKHQIHASAAEAMLKIAEESGVCRAQIASPQQLAEIRYSIKLAQGEAVPNTPMGAPPAMAGGAPPQATAPAPAPEAPAESAVEQAFSEQMQELQMQMQAMQQTLDVLTTVQERAQQIEAEQGGAPMQGMPPGMDPGMATDPNAGAAPTAMPVDPNAAAAQAGQPPGMEQQPGMAQEQQLPIMRTEEPSSQEIANQVSPEFLEQAGQFQDAGAFDAGAIGSLATDPSLKALGSEYAANLEDSIDDLGRTLLTLYMQEPQLKEQLGDESFVELETQLRDTFQNLGQLVLSLTHNTAMLSQDATN